MQGEEQYPERKSSILKKIGHRDPFAVPEGYFGSLSGVILDRVEKEKEVPKAEGKISRISTMWRKPMSYAAAIVLALIVSLFLLQDRYAGDAIDADWANEISLEEIESYVLDNLYEFEEGDFLSDDLHLETDLLEGSFDEGELESILPEMLDDIDLQTIENML